VSAISANLKYQLFLTFAANGDSCFEEKLGRVSTKNKYNLHFVAALALILCTFASRETNFISLTQ